jgi:hypothetical protein
MSDEVALKYVGANPATDWLPGVPARDLSAEEAEQYPQAASSALYEQANKPTRRKPTRGNRT